MNHFKYLKTIKILSTMEPGPEKAGLYSWDSAKFDRNAVWIKSAYMLLTAENDKKVYFLFH